MAKYWIQFIKCPRSLKLSLWLVIGMSCSSQVLSQNLIRNWSFEDITCPDNTIASFSESEFWNATGADAYWMHYSCPIVAEDVQYIIGMKPNLVPYHKDGYVSLENLIFKNGYVITEGVSQELLKPLKQGRYYLLEMASIKYTVENPDEEIPSECSLFDDRGLELRLGMDRISFEVESKIVDFQPYITNIEPNSDLILSDINGSELPSNSSSWAVHWDCFEVEEDYTHFGITGPNKVVENLNSCMDVNIPGVLYWSGFAIDAISLYEVPEKIDTSIAYCFDEVSFDLSGVLDAPFLDKTEILWEDGTNRESRNFNQPGTYKADLILPCVSIPLTVQVVKDDCDVNIYMPNIISRSGTYPNNELKPTIESKYPVASLSWSVYDRWGNLVFHTDKEDDAWSGNEYPSIETGVFIWKLKYALLNDLTSGELYGTVTLVN